MPRYYDVVRMNSRMLRSSKPSPERLAAAAPKSLLGRFRNGCSVSPAS